MVPFVAMLMMLCALVGVVGVYLHRLRLRAATPLLTPINTDALADSGIIDHVSTLPAAATNNVTNELPVPAQTSQGEALRKLNCDQHVETEDLESGRACAVSGRHYPDCSPPRGDLDCQLSGGEQCSTQAQQFELPTGSERVVPPLPPTSSLVRLYEDKSWILGSCHSRDHSQPSGQHAPDGLSGVLAAASVIREAVHTESGDRHPWNDEDHVQADASSAQRKVCEALQFDLPTGSERVAPSMPPISSLEKLYGEDTHWTSGVCHSRDYLQASEQRGQVESNNTAQHSHNDEDYSRTCSDAESHCVIETEQFELPLGSELAASSIPPISSLAQLYEDKSWTVSNSAAQPQPSEQLVQKGCHAVLAEESTACQALCSDDSDQPPQNDDDDFQSAAGSEQQEVNEARLFELPTGSERAAPMVPPTSSLVQLYDDDQPWSLNDCHKDSSLPSGEHTWATPSRTFIEDAANCQHLSPECSDQHPQNKLCTGAEQHAANEVQYFELPTGSERAPPSMPPTSSILQLYQTDTCWISGGSHDVAPSSPIGKQDE